METDHKNSKLDKSSFKKTEISYGSSSTSSFSENFLPMTIEITQIDDDVIMSND